MSKLSTRVNGQLVTMTVDSNLEDSAMKFEPNLPVEVGLYRGFRYEQSTLMTYAQMDAAVPDSMVSSLLIQHGSKGVTVRILETAAQTVIRQA